MDGYDKYPPILPYRHDVSFSGYKNFICVNFFSSWVVVVLGASFRNCICVANFVIISSIKNWFFITPLSRSARKTIWRIALTIFFRLLCFLNLRTIARSCDTSCRQQSRWKSLHVHDTSPKSIDFRYLKICNRHSSGRVPNTLQSMVDVDLAVFLFKSLFIMWSKLYASVRRVVNTVLSTVSYLKRTSQWEMGKEDG